MLICNECKIELNKENKYGANNHLCKPCYRAYVRNRYYERYKSKKLKAMKKYSLTQNGKKHILEATLKAMERHSEKYSARVKLHNAVQKGEIVKPRNCEIRSDCKGRLEAHHYKGYEGDKWMKVRWLCAKHHHQIERYENQSNNN